MPATPLAKRALALLAVVCILHPSLAEAKHKHHHAAAQKKYPTSYLSLSPVHHFTTVVVDAGHGGHDPGGIPGQRIPEKPYTLDTALRLRSLLIKAGFHVVLTRSNDTFVSLPDRVRIANAQSNAIFVSIHFNSSPTSTGHGFETYFYALGARPLAVRIQGRVMGALPTTINRGVKYRGYFVLRKTSIPSVLVEGGFLTNPYEASIIQRSDYRQRLAKKIAEAIIEQRDS